MNALTLAEAAALWRGVLAHTTHTIEYVPPDKPGAALPPPISAQLIPIRLSEIALRRVRPLSERKGAILRVVATIGAGERYDEPVLPGQAVRLMTGCAVRAAVRPSSCRSRPPSGKED